MVIRGLARALAIGVALVVLGGLMVFGPGLPWSPLHPGYVEMTLRRVRVLAPAGRVLPEAYRHLDEMVAEAEEAHGYRAPRRITVVLLASWPEFERRLPWMRGSRAGGVTLATGTAIYITPRIDERRLDHGEFLRHELSHAVLAQNTAPWNSFRFQDHQWLYEGVAVWFGRQQTYVTQAEFLARAPHDGVAIHLGPQTAESSRIEIRYRYIVWRNFNDYLMQTYGRDRWRVFLQAANADPGRIDAAFAAAFGRSRAHEAAAFEARVLAGAFTPAGT